MWPAGWPLIGPLGGMMLGQGVAETIRRVHPCAPRGPNTWARLPVAHMPMAEDPAVFRLDGTEFRESFDPHDGAVRALGQFLSAAGARRRSMHRSYWATGDRRQLRLDRARTARVGDSRTWSAMTPAGPPSQAQNLTLAE